MDQPDSFVVTSCRSTARHRRGRIARAGLVSALCAVLAAGFVVGPRASTSHAATAGIAAHAITQSVDTNTTGGPGTM